ncbi:hypothetical protein [Actinoalloteichus sp. GBA129-24]|uniref:hypothetical protein n=1 Tax=Actinoalloteichus sp. GBA129-24 TaxID=1612551 RepID=UPI000950AEEC|nr:hypothetical protein [Actinoalloteichus sp. GBA129-24]APU20962.1 hypothetical protein UA75_14760 [Actinoalloteichus sp. GBA129-24]APU24211.1 hypothetical protein UA75_31240 [Actinoalloteichus sp. GBA129-24]
MTTRRDVTYVTWHDLTGDDGEHITWARTIDEVGDVDVDVKRMALGLAGQRLAETMTEHGYRVRWVRNEIGADVDNGTHDTEWHRARIRALVPDVDRWAVDAIPQARKLLAEITAEVDAEAKREAAAEKRAAARARRGHCQNDYCDDDSRKVALKEIIDGTGRTGYVCAACAAMPESCEVSPPLE